MGENSLAALCESLLVADPQRSNNIPITGLASHSLQAGERRLVMARPFVTHEAGSLLLHGMLEKGPKRAHYHMHEPSAYVVVPFSRHIDHIVSLLDCTQQ